MLSKDLLKALQDELKPIFKEWVKEAILEMNENPIADSENNTINGYITEKQAKEILKKRTTWFWDQRKKGILPYKKLGATVYYKEEDIYKLLEKI